MGGNPCYRHDVNAAAPEPLARTKASGRTVEKDTPRDRRCSSHCLLLLLLRRHSRSDRHYQPPHSFGRRRRGCYLPCRCRYRCRGRSSCRYRCRCFPVALHSHSPTFPPPPHAAAAVVAGAAAVALAAQR